MKLIKPIIAAAALVAAALPASAQQMRLLSSWDQNYAYNPYILEPFIKGVEDAAQGRMKITVRTRRCSARVANEPDMFGEAVTDPKTRSSDINA